MVYAVLVLLFGTFLQPITILFSLPLSIGGAIVALLLTGKQLTTPVWIGILMLMGIVTKNAIMLVEFAVESIREGKKRDEAIIDAGMKRARPIVMTTIAMAAGMMPSALAFGADRARTMSVSMRPGSAARISMPFFFSSFSYIRRCFASCFSLISSFSLRSAFRNLRLNRHSCSLILPRFVAAMVSRTR